MNISNVFKSLKSKIYMALGLSLILPAVAFSSAYAASSTASSNSSNNAGSSSDTAKLNNIISRGNKEIDRRLTTLNNLTSLISSSNKLNSSDKTALTNEVSNEINGLTALKSTLDSCTTLSCAQTSASSIFTEYRVYALVVPKIHLISDADKQQTTEADLTKIANQLTTRIASSTNTTLQGDLTTMKNDITAAQNLSSSVETNVDALTPQNFNDNHSVLVQYYNDLKTAHSDIQNAYQEGKAITNGLK